MHSVSKCCKFRDPDCVAKEMKLHGHNTGHASCSLSLRTVPNLLVLCSVTQLITSCDLSSLSAQFCHTVDHFIWSLISQCSVLPCCWSLRTMSHFPVSSVMQFVATYNVSTSIAQSCHVVGRCMWCLISQYSVLSSSWSLYVMSHLPVLSSVIQLITLYDVSSLIAQFCHAVDHFMWCLIFQYSVLPCSWSLYVMSHLPVLSSAMQLII
jgi:hypothetical protein